MTKLIVHHPRLGITHKRIALRMVNGAIHRDHKGEIVRFHTQTDAERYAEQSFQCEKQPTITVLR